MTYSIRHIVGVITRETREGFLGTKLPLFGKTWGEKKLVGSWTLNDFYVYAVGCHVGHSTEALVALFAYWLFFSDGTWATECATFRAPWVLKVLAFHLCCEATFVGGWHHFTYVSSAAKGLQPFKFNARHQYEPDAYEDDGARVGVLSSSTGHLQREIFYNTLGWLQSGCWQCLMTWAWASGALAVAPDFASRLGPNLLGLHLITYWREIHFYWCHRGIHPWWDMRNGLRQGDVGAFLYRWAHSLHHKSHNPGPWSGLSMHPVEHFLYYSCAWLLPLVFTVHPLHFLYAKYHADISPIGGHDGFDEPSCNGDFHYLHHAKFECNYGVPFPVDFDKMFGTWVDYKEFKANGGKMPKAQQDKIARRRGKAALVAGKDGTTAKMD